MPEPESTKPAITATQLLLQTLEQAEESLPLHELMRRVGQAVDALREAGYVVEAFLRSPYCGNVWSEQFERSLWYWLSNGFVEEEDTPAQGLKLSRAGLGLFEDHQPAAVIRRNLDEDALLELTSAVKEAVGAPSE